MPQWKCPTCGNVSEVGEHDQVTVCQYCRTCYTVEGAIIKEHYLVPAYYSSSQAIENLVLWVKKQTGAEEDLPLHLEVSSTNLDYYPFWHLIVNAETRFSGTGQDATYSSPEGGNAFRQIHFVSKGESGNIDRGFTLAYSATSIPKELIEYQFPTRSRKYFSESYTRESGGSLHNGVITQKMVEARALDDVKRMLGELIGREIFRVDSRDDKIETLSIFYMHVPIWCIEYKYRGGGYQAYVDASTGRIVHATYPVSLEHRTVSGTIAAANISIGLLLGVGLGTVSSVAGITAFLGFFVVGAILAWRAVKSGKGREKAE